MSSQPFHEMDFSKADLLVVGSGFYGATIAERAAEEGFRVILIDKRNHVGGNSYSYKESSTGIEVHKYGSHLFHTSSERVWNYISRFTSFNNYRHSVWTVHKGMVYSMPINLSTISSFYGRALSPDEARSLLTSAGAIGGGGYGNLEEKAIASVGRDLYRALIEGYTQKQWQTPTTDLPASVIGRLPVRFNFDNRYFNDTWEGLPLNGYGEVFRNMLKSEYIRVYLGVDFFEIAKHIPSHLPIVFTGPIDKYFAYSEGRLGWRTLDFQQEVLEVSDFQGTSVMNYADTDVAFTRIHEFKHLHPERPPISATVIAREFSRFAMATDEPYYPINSPDDRKRIEKYRERAKHERCVHFGGRLGTYQYLDMHMAIASALNHWETEVAEMLRRKNLE